MQSKSQYWGKIWQLDYFLQLFSPSVDTLRELLKACSVINSKCFYQSLTQNPNIEKLKLLPLWIEIKMETNKPWYFIVSHVAFKTWFLLKASVFGFTDLSALNDFLRPHRHRVRCIVQIDEINLTHNDDW